MVTTSRPSARDRRGIVAVALRTALRSQRGISAPQVSAKRASREKLPMGMMPGTMGNVHAHRPCRVDERRIGVELMKNWVIAELAPASTFAFECREIILYDFNLRCHSGRAATSMWNQSPVSPTDERHQSQV